MQRDARQMEVKRASTSLSLSSGEYGSCHLWCIRLFPPEWLKTNYKMNFTPKV